MFSVSPSHPTKRRRLPSVTPRGVRPTAPARTRAASRDVPGCGRSVRPGPVTASTVACTESPGRSWAASRVPGRPPRRRVPRGACVCGASASLPGVQSPSQTALVADAACSSVSCGRFSGTVTAAPGPVAVLGEALVLPGVGRRHVGVGGDRVDAGAEPGVADGEHGAGGGVGAGDPGAGQLVAGVGGPAGDTAADDQVAARVGGGRGGREDEAVGRRGQVRPVQRAEVGSARTPRWPGRRRSRRLPRRSSARSTGGRRRTGPGSRRTGCPGGRGSGSAGRRRGRPAP